jgi:DNA replication protein DnaC
MNMTKEVIAASENDRNILILGSAGTGKSNLLSFRIIAEILRMCISHL